MIEPATGRRSRGAGPAPARLDPAPAHPGLAAPAPVRRRRQPAAVNVLLRASVPLGLLGLWWLGSNAGWIDPIKLSPPQDVWREGVDLIGSGQLWDNLSISLRRAFTGLFFAALVALPLALIAGLYRLGDQLVDPTVQMIRTIPFLAVSPLSIIWLGIGETQKVFLIALACAIPLYINSYAGVRRSDPKVIEAAQAYGVTRWELIRTVILPGAIPNFLVGLRFSVGISLLALIFVEQTNAPEGIGRLMQLAQQLFESETILVLLIVYAIWGLLGDLMIRGLEWLLLPWERGVHSRL